MSHCVHIVLGVENINETTNKEEITKTIEALPVRWIRVYESEGEIIASSDPSCSVSGEVYADFSDWCQEVEQTLWTMDAHIELKGWIYDTESPYETYGDVDDDEDLFE